MHRRSLRERLAALRPSGLMLATLFTIGMFGAGITWAVKTDGGSSGEPVVVMKIDQSDPIVTSSVEKPQEEEPQAASEPEEDVTIDEASPAPVDLDLSDAGEQQSAALLQPSRQQLGAAPIQSVSQKGPHGLLPRIAKNGKKPWMVYRAPVTQQVLQSDAPKVAIVLGGMGINLKLTDQAIENLPGQITLAFAPYGKRLQRKINYARKYGHEVMLQLPMEPFGYPAVDPGPRTLLTSAGGPEIIDNLKWHMSRFSGYTGVINYLGAQFTSDGTNFAPVLQELKSRGLIYLDDGTSGRSMAPSLGQVIGMPVRTASEMIDSEANFNAISAALARLEDQARQDGFAIGVGTGLAITIDAINTWARDLAARNVILVPVSAAYLPLQG